MAQEEGLCGLGYICPTDIAELCAEDGKAYRNKCEAYCAGATRNTDLPRGACGDDVAKR